MNPLYERLVGLRADARKLFVPYLMAGAPSVEVFASAYAELASLGDVVEVGLPYSDPLMDGPVIATAGERALAAGTGPLTALDIDLAAALSPRVVMTYFNPIHRIGEAEFCDRLVRRGFAGMIVPDLPLEESGGLRSAAEERGLAWIPLVAPTSPPDRVEAICATATGFVYAVSTLGVTGVRESLSERASSVVERCRAATDAPVCIGVGVSNASQATEAAAVADGVVVGSALVAALMERGVEAATALARDIRNALDDVE